MLSATIPQITGLLARHVVNIALNAILRQITNRLLFLVDDAPMDFSLPTQPILVAPHVLPIALYAQTVQFVRFATLDFTGIVKLVPVKHANSHALNAI